MLSRPMALLPFVVLGAVAVVDVVMGPEYGFLSLLALGPVFASLVGGIRRTLVVGGLALVLSFALAGYDRLLGERQSYLSVITIAGVTLASMLAIRDRQRRERELADVRSVAEVAQRVLLRPVPRRAGELRAAVSYTSAAAEARIGGDLYEMVTSPAGVRLIVGDVQGKGLEAVETAAVVLGAFREAAHDEEDLRGVSGRLEKALNRSLSGEQFVTAVLAEIDPDRTMTILNYGHPAPLIMRADGTLEFAEPPEAAPPLGIAILQPEGPQPYDVAFARDDQVLFYTDGVIEARDPAGEFYPLADRASVLKAADPEAALDGLRQDLIAHVSAPLRDDAAMLLLRFRGSTA
jgi:serine phosphatase RsbU (regulator of sigma subunit)